MDKDELEAWKRHPVTVEFMAYLINAIEPDKEWRNSGTWDRVCRLQGQRQVLEIIEGFGNA